MHASRAETTNGNDSRQAEYDFVVLGAGVAGLAFAHEVARAGKSVLVLEREPEIGGLSRTLDYGGFRFDYCAHRFHSGDPSLIGEVAELVGPGFRKHTKKSRIFMFDRYLRYPFELQNLLRAMPKLDALLAGLSFGKNWLSRKLGLRRAGAFRNYRDWFTYHFGNKLYAVMCEPYTSKIWKMDPRLISADWADERFQGIKVRRLIGRIIKKALTLDFSSYSIEDDSLAPDGGDFWYGDGGAQDIPDAYARRLGEVDSTILTETRITEIAANRREVRYEHDGSTFVARAREHVISTIPLHTCYDLLDRGDAMISHDLAELRYMDIVFVYLMLDRESVSNDHWLYFPDEEIIFNRVVEFRNWSESMCPPGRTALCLDITCYDGDSTWSMGDEELVRASTEGCVRAGLIAERDVSDTLVVRVRDAYPVYDLGYREKIDRIVQFIEDGDDVLCLGRTGIFKYNNADGSIEMGRDLGRKLLQESREKSMRAWKVKQVSY